MMLNGFCKGSWIEVENGGKKYRKSRHCCEKEIDLYCSIVRWQSGQVKKRLHKIDSNATDNDNHKKILIKKRDCLSKQFEEFCKSAAFYSSENEILMKCLICGIARNRAVWREIRSFFYCCYSRNNWEDGLSECFQILSEKNLYYLFSLNLEKVGYGDNETVMKQISGYIGKCLYSRDILKEYLGEEPPAGMIDDEDIPTDEPLPDGEDILSYIFSLFEKACHEITIYAFIHESLSARKRKSDLARQHKNRLSEYIRGCLTKEEHEILEPFHADMITDYIEDSLSEGDDRDIVISLKNEHKKAVYVIKSVFENARKKLNPDNFISENIAGINRHSRSSFFKYEETELINFIRPVLNKISENITYFQDVTPKYIADEIGRMITEKEISL